MQVLGGSLFVRNAFKYDYCLEASLASICELCDEVIVLEAYSEDNTWEFLNDMRAKYSNLNLIRHEWECEKNYLRYSRLANIAINNLHMDWHFMIQADEVLHEDSFDIIRKYINSSDSYDAYTARRFNFWYDARHYFPDNSKYLPCSNHIVRLGRKDMNVFACSDAESLSGHNCGNGVDINLFHYGFIRDSSKHLDKIIDVQTWFWGNPNIDKRVLENKEETGIFEPERYVPIEELQIFDSEHPKFAQKWLKERGYDD